MHCLTAACATEPESFQMVEDQHLDLQQRVRAVSKATAPVDGVLNLSGVSSEMLQQQFMFAIAVHEGVPRLQNLLLQMRQAKHSLLEASRKGEPLPSLYKIVCAVVLFMCAV